MAGGSRRDLVLPALHAVQARIGWVSQGALNYISRRLTVPPAELWGVVTFYHLLSTKPRPPVVAHVCDDIACRIRGGEELCEALERAMGHPGAHGGNGRATTWMRSPCLGQCERAPAVMLTVAGETPRTITLAPVEDGAASVLEALRSPPQTSDTRVGSRAPDERRREVRHSVPQVGQPGLRLIGRIGRVDPTSLAAYRASDGYRGLARAVEIGPAGVIAEVVASKLLGRGGAAFPTGRKWDAVAKAEARPHYLVCNADESEPGTFKDRLLMEEDPFALVEGMTIAGYATGCERGYLYLRGEYPLAAERMAGAIAAARAAGLLGADVMGAGFAFDIEIRRGAGAYICGEETALFNSIEGKRGEPRNKPPFPVQVGLFGRPTVVNNVETLVNVPALLREGGAAYGGIGTEGSTGPKLFCVCGQVARPGLYETPFGITLRQLLDQAGAGPVRAVLLGGAAGVFVGPSDLDVPLTFEGTRAIGATLGSGVVMVFGESVDLLDIVRRIAEFFRDESCGQCVPCRVGTVRQEELLARLRAGRPLGSGAEELALLKDLGQVMRDASICGLGQTASSAIESAIFRLAIAGSGR
ncbi:MAG TPA: NAD(P)H-dependent oxidoreductase subunit E [Methylomirabilota bacterium]|nr:NAD(P)H-dependent oxidoreductase subunit E [Methylomirabilota bacterium]